MWQGYVGFGGNEVINVARLVKYADEGGVPPDTIVDPQVGPYGALAAALGDPDYRTVVLDQPGWYDPTNPDSVDFAGLMPLDITGLDGSTRGRSVNESIGDGGTPTKVRAGSRTIAVTTQALAASEAGLDAGLAWLTGLLHPPCATGAEACGGAALSLFSAPPVYCSDLTDEDADPIVSLLIPGTMNLPGPAWAYTDVSDGALLDPVCGPVTATLTAQLGEEVPVDTHRVVVVDLVDSTGTVHASGVLDLPEDGAPATIDVTTDPSPGYPLQWQVELHWYTLSTDVISGGGAADPPADGIASGDADMTDGELTLIWGGDAGPGDVLTDGGILTLVSLTYTRQPFLTVDQCLVGLRRSYRNVVTVEGPTATDLSPLSDGEAWAATVEWTWVATDPYPYGDATSLVGDVLVGRLTTSTHPAVRVATTANVPLYLSPSDGGHIDRVFYGTGIVPIGAPFLLPGDRVLFKNQTNPAENGIRVYNGPGTYWTRATDMDSSWDTEVVGASAFVQEGDTQANTDWHTTSVSGGTFDTTAVTWTAGAGAGGPHYDDGYGYKGPGIQLGDNEDVTGDDTACPIPDPVTVLCGDDPDLPPTLLPPTAPTLPDPGMPTVDDYVRRAFQVPTDLSLVPGAVLSMSIRSLGEDAYRGIRVRLWADPDPDFGVEDECAFEQEFYIAYLPAGETVTIDGPNHRVWVTCPNGLEADHERNMRGAYGGPFVFPELRCGARYHITVDVPATIDAAGVSVDVTASRRGG